MQTKRREIISNTRPGGREGRKKWACNFMDESVIRLKSAGRQPVETIPPGSSRKTAEKIFGKGVDKRRRIILSNGRLHHADYVI